MVFMSAEQWCYFMEHGLERPDSSQFKLLNPKTENTRCHVCDLPELLNNLLTAAHLIPSASQRDFALIPNRVMNLPENFVWAHRRICNDKAELEPRQIIWRLWFLYEVRELPAFLPVETRELWAKETGGQMPVKQPAREPRPMPESLHVAEQVEIRKSKTVVRKEYKIPIAPNVETRKANKESVDLTGRFVVPGQVAVRNKTAPSTEQEV